ncbi:hypothetical protein LSCM1_02740 [Leishmania martiniquensis]|uniref:Uncharacterized protein n=1 Tax=Leishmania martiniquensis TaxID=1580590 RepID=A0A836GKT2_9TRYP|nr:hypothetical protein LSCM1_02740 [Leishmania martiniquensis]
MEDAPSTPLSLALTATASAVVSSVKRPYRFTDDTLPSPPQPPFSSYQSRVLFRSALSETPLSPRWMLSESTAEDEVDGHDGGPKRRETEGSSMLNVGDAEGRCGRGQTAILLSPAPADAPTDATPSSTMAAAEIKDNPQVRSSAYQPQQDGVPHISAAAPIKSGGEDSISSFPPQSLITNAATFPKATVRPLPEFSPSSPATALSPSSQPARSLTPGSSSPTARVGNGSADGASSTATPNATSDFLPLQVQQAERAIDAQLVFDKETRRENEELRRQMEALLRIQEELERRCQRWEAVTAGAAEGPAPQRALALEREQALAQLREVYEGQLQKSRKAEIAAQSDADALAKEVVMLRSELAGVHDELRASMEQQLKCQRQSDEARNVQVRMAAECATLRSAADDVTSQLKELHKKLWAAEERAAAAELALQALCHQLAAATEAAMATEGHREEVEHTPPLHTSADAKPINGSPTSEFLSSGSHAPATALLFDEAAVLTAVVSAMERHSMSGLLSSPLNSSPPRDDEGATALSPSDPSTVATTMAPPLSQYPRSESVLRSSAGVSTALMQSHLSNAGLLRCRQHRRSMQIAMARVSDGYQRVAQEAAAAASSRAAKLEQTLSDEVEELRARLRQPQQVLLPHKNSRQEKESHTSEREEAECQTTLSSLQHRPCVGVVTDAMAAASSDAPRVAATASACAVSATTIAYEESLAEMQRQLRHERSYIRQLQKEVQSLRTSNDAVSALKGLSQTIQDMRVAVCRLLRDTVADVQSIATQARQQPQLVATDNGDESSELVWQGDTGQVLHGERHTVREDPKHPMKSTSPRRRPDSVRRASAALPSLPSLLDFAFVRAVHKCILRAEAHVQQVSAALLSSYQQAAAVARTSSGIYEADHDVVYATGALYHPYRMPAPATDVADDPQRGANGIYQEPPSRWPPDDGHPSGGALPAPSLSAPSTADSSKRTAQQEKVYAELRGLLQRLSTAKEGITACTPVPLCTVPEECRRWSGTQPPRTRALGSSDSLTAQPSPYVAACLAESAGLRRAALSSLARDSAGGPAAITADGRLGFSLLTDAIQELRNVGRLLDTIRDAEETREARWQQCMQEWQDAIVAAVDRVWERINDALALARRPEVGEGGLPCDTWEPAMGAGVAPSFGATSLGDRAGPVECERGQAWQRQNTQQACDHDMQNAAMPPHQPSRLAKVLSGMMR